MFTALRSNSTIWITGIILAVGGGCIVRFVVPALAGQQGRLTSALTVAGHLMALIGLAVICLGVNRRIKRENAALAAAAEPEDAGATDERAR